MGSTISRFAVAGDRGARQRDPGRGKCRQTEGGSYRRTILGGDDDSFREDATKYALGFRRADQEPRFVANLYYAAERSHRLIEPAAPWQQDRFHIYSFRRDGASERGMTLRVDGVEAAAVTAHIDPPGFPGTGHTIGQGGNLTGAGPDRFFRGRIAEILIYNRALDRIECLKVEGPGRKIQALARCRTAR